MDRLSQKELLSEGFGSLLKKVAGKTAQAVGAVGGALKSASDAGITGGLGDVAKGAASGWKKTGEALTGRVKKLEKFLDDQGLMKVNKPKPGETPIQEPVNKRDMKGNVAIVPIVQYDYTRDAETKKISGKEPMEGVKIETRKYKWKDKRWEVLRDKQRKTHAWGVELDREDIAEAQSDSEGPLTGKVVKHETSKGGLAYGTVVGYADEYVAIDPFKGNRAPGIYGKDETKVEESTAEEATQHYSAPKTEGTSQKNLLRQLTLLCD